MNDKSLTVLIPLYNKEKLIKVAINETTKLLKGLDYEIIVIENESTDNSRLVVEELIKNEYINLKLINSKKGLGNALKAGINLSSKDYLLCVPADFTSGTSEIKYFKDEINSDYTITSRQHKDSNAPQDFNRKIISNVFNFLKKAILNINYSDTQFSFLIRTSIAKKIANKCRSTGFFITTELTYFALKEGINIKEISVVLHEQENNKSTVKIFRDSFSIFLEMLKLFLREGRL